MEKKFKYLLSFNKMHLYSKKYLIKYPAKLRKDIIGSRKQKMLILSLLSVFVQDPSPCDGTLHIQEWVIPSQLNFYGNLFIEAP